MVKMRTKGSREGLGSLPYQLNTPDPGIVILRPFGCMDYTCAGKAFMEIISKLKTLKPQTLIVDLGEVEEIQDFGLAVILELMALVSGWSGVVELKGGSKRVRDALRLVSLDEYQTMRGPVRKKRPDVITRFGDAFIRHLSELAYLISFAGSVTIAFLKSFFGMRGRRSGDTVIELEKVGVDAIPIVALISLLLGLIMAFMSSVQLREFGASIYVASLVALAMVRELGPIITAIIVAGRSGSSFAAEIGTMKISEEVDALFTMGVEPTEFLVIPKLVASIIAMPILTLLCDFFAISGGLIVGVFMLDLSFSAYIHQTTEAITAFDLLWGFFKAVPCLAL